MTAPATAFNGAATYRALLKALARFPSRNRGRLIDECKAEWRANAATPPGDARDRQRAVAVDSLMKLKAYERASGDDASLFLG